MRLFLILLCSVLAGHESSAAAASDLRIGWTNNMLTLSSPTLPGGPVDIWYLEAFCRSGSTHRDWRQRPFPTAPSCSKPRRMANGCACAQTSRSVEMMHQIRARADEVEFQLEIVNRSAEPVDVQWFQPCMRVDRFTGLKQSNYIQGCFIFTKGGLTTLDKTRRTEDAIYRGGQVYVPAGVSTKDVNPRPLSPDVPVNGLIGCFSADGKSLLAMAWDNTQELFQGVIVCIHNDPRIGGLKPGERKTLRGRVYFMPNDTTALLKRYERDFPNNRGH
jgi:hypothetical protein